MPMSVCLPSWSLDFAFGTHYITPHYDKQHLEHEEERVGLHTKKKKRV